MKIKSIVFIVFASAVSFTIIGCSGDVYFLRHSWHPENTMGYISVSGDMDTKMYFYGDMELKPLTAKGEDYEYVYIQHRLNPYLRDLNPGRYQIRKIYLATYVFSNFAEINVKDEKLEFEVNENEIVYLGDFKVNVEINKQDVLKLYEDMDNDDLVDYILENKEVKLTITITLKDTDFAESKLRKSYKYFDSLPFINFTKFVDNKDTLVITRDFKYKKNGRSVYFINK